MLTQRATASEDYLDLAARYTMIVGENDPSHAANAR